ncbi:hypothetical protein HK098_006912 [Nowakowskiella sp. JEL0407]|nr:hypothetical protein HK098_006912 [Nowakowskiella sp. JEL0407]
MLYQEVSFETVRYRFLRWVGFHVLKYAEDGEEQSELDQALVGGDAEKLVIAFGKNNAAGDASHRLIHFAVREDFGSTGYIFAPLKEGNNSYLVSAGETLGSIDSIIESDLLFHMTRSESYPCKETEMKNVLDQLGNPSKPKLYLVIPNNLFKELGYPDPFENFQYQKYRGERNELLDELTFTNVKNVEQFVLELDSTLDLKR